MKRFNEQPNVVGELIRKARIKKGLSKVALCTKLQLLGINLTRVEIYRIESSKMIVKDFELIGFCIALDLDYEELKKLITLQD